MTATTLEQIIEESVARGVAKALAEIVPSPPKAWNEPATMTTKEAAAALGISVKAMRIIIKQPDFDAQIWAGSKMVILTDRFHDWMKKQTTQGKTLTLRK